MCYPNNEYSSLPKLPSTYVLNSTSSIHNSLNVESRMLHIKQTFQLFWLNELKPISEGVQEKGSVKMKSLNENFIQCREKVLL